MSVFDLPEPGAMPPGTNTGLVAGDQAELDAALETAASKRLGVIGWASILWLALVVLVALTVPWLPLDDPNESFVELKQPGGGIAGPFTDGHLLGGDAAARDLFSRLCWGARYSLLIGVAAVALGVVVGGTLGLLAGYYRGRVDGLLSGLFDTLLAVPQLVLALTFVSTFASGPAVSSARRTTWIVVALGVVSIPILARITRATTLAWTQREFVVAARALGTPNGRIIRREILPNVLPAIYSIALLGIAVVIVAEGGLAVLGIGIQAPAISWGSVLAGDQRQLTTDLPGGTSPWGVLAPSIAIFLTVLALNYLGDVVRARHDARETVL